MTCPICEGKTEEFVVDTAICTECSHVFKKNLNDMAFTGKKDLHLFDNVLEIVRQMSDKMDEGEMVYFNFPSMILYTMEVHPNDFYKDDYNHFFNQMSLNILAERSGLEIIEQKNVWTGKIAITDIAMRKKKVE